MSNIRKQEIMHRLDELVRRRDSAVTDCDSAIEAAREIQSALTDAVDLLEELLREEST